jgi:hypothetical protein
VITSTVHRVNRAWIIATVIVLGAIVLTISHLPVRAQSSSSAVVSIAVPVTVQLEGTTALSVPAGPPVLGQLTVKSNVPWVLVVDVGPAAPALVAWSDGGAWQPLSAQGVALHGPKGIHRLTYRLRTTASAATTVRFTARVAP